MLTAFDAVLPELTERRSFPRFELHRPAGDRLEPVLWASLERRLGVAPVTTFGRRRGDGKILEMR